MQRLIRQFPVAAFIAITTILGWVAVAVGTAVMPINAENGATAMHGILIFVIASPSVVGVVLTAIVDGRDGLKELWSRMARWRVHPKWYLAALVVPFSIAGLDYLILGTLGGPVAPINLVDQIKFMLPFAIMAPLFEEFGWRGYALPRLQRRHSALVSALIVGLGWALWHTAINFLGVAGLHTGPMLLLLLLIVAQLNFADSVLMSWINNSTGGSMLLVILGHFSITMGNVFSPATVTTTDFIIANVTSVAVHWIVVIAIIALAGPKRLARGERPA